MKNNLLLIFLCLILVGCVCKDEIIASYKLNDFERTLIPYTSFQDIKYIDAEGTVYFGHSQPLLRTTESYKSGPESCGRTEFEQITNFLSFYGKDFILSLELARREQTFFEITSFSDEKPKLRGGFILACTGLFNKEIKERLTDINTAGFHFENVLVFQNCRSSSLIDTILYSKANGVEFIKFHDDTWLKLKQ